MDGEERTTKYAKYAKKQAKLFKDQSHRQSTILKQRLKQLGLWVNFGHYPKFEHEWFVHQALSRISRIS